MIGSRSLDLNSSFYPRSEISKAPEGLARQEERQGQKGRGQRSSQVASDVRSNSHHQRAAKADGQPSRPIGCSCSAWAAAIASCIVCSSTTSPISIPRLLLPLLPRQPLRSFARLCSRRRLLANFSAFWNSSLQTYHLSIII